MLITDHDLLIIEPTVFMHAQAAATALYASSDGAVADTTLSSAAADFAALGIGSEHVAVIAATKQVEIIARLSGTQLDVSLPRAASGDAKIRPGDGSSLALVIPTFARLIGQVQAAALRALGLDEDDPDQPLEESDIVNPDAVAAVIALRTLARAFAIAAAQEPADESLAARATLYRGLAAEAAAGAAVLLDLDGDGEADATRRFSAAAWQRT